MSRKYLFEKFVKSSPNRFSFGRWMHHHYARNFLASHEINPKTLPNERFDLFLVPTIKNTVC